MPLPDPPGFKTYPIAHYARGYYWAGWVAQAEMRKLICRVAAREGFRPLECEPDLELAEPLVLRPVQIAALRDALASTEWVPDAVLCDGPLLGPFEACQQCYREYVALPRGDDGYCSDACLDKHDRQLMGDPDEGP